MRILFLASDLNKIGGIEKYNREFMLALRKAGAEVYFVPLYGVSLSQKTSFILRIFWEAARRKPRIICCSHVAFSPICYYIKKILGIDYTVNIYGIEVINIKSKLHRKALGVAKFIIKLFDRTALNVVKQVPETAKKIVSLPNFVDGERFYIKEKSKKFVEKFNLKNSKVILTLCRLSFSEVENKGYERVLRVMPEVIKQVPNVKYLLVGSGDDEERIKGIVKELDMENHVIMPGRASDEEMVDYYNLADVFVYPSKNEGFPAIVLLEALVCGKPVIGGHYGEKSEKEIFNDKLGYIIYPDDRQELTKSIVNILKGDAPKDFFNADLIRKRVLDEYGKNRFEERVGQILELFKTFKMAVFMSHPIQYQAPFLREIAAAKEIDLTAYFFWDFGVKKTFDKQFDRDVMWDIPLFEGYRHKFLRNFSLKPSSDFWGTLNFGVVSELIKNHYDAVLVYGWNYFANWLIFLTAFILGTRVFLSGESPLNQELLKPKWKIKIKKIILGWLFRRISAFLYIGEENKKFYQYYGVPGEKLVFCPYAVDNSRFMAASDELGVMRNELRKKQGIGKDDVVILFVGKLIRKKRPMDLLRAFSILRTSDIPRGSTSPMSDFPNIDDSTAWKSDIAKLKGESNIAKSDVQHESASMFGTSDFGGNPTSRTSDVHLLYVGDGELRPNLEKYTKEHNLKNIYFVGFKNQTELPEYYTIADIFVLPSGAGETWGLVVNEAMCFGLPIIVSDVVGCGPDLVKHGENGYIYPVGNIEKLTDYLEDLIKNPEKRKSFGKKSFEIIQEYTYEKDIKGILEALK